MIHKLLIILSICTLWLTPLRVAEAQNGDGAQSMSSTKPVHLSPPPDTFLLTVPLSGPLESMGRSAVNGAEMALATWGGGSKLKIVDEAGPDQSEPRLNKVAVALGYFTETRFAADAPSYLYRKTPVLLPFLTTGEAAGRGPSSFFRLMPTFEEQGRFMALEILTMRRRYRRIMVVTGEGEFQQNFTAALTGALAEPPQPPPPAKGKKAAPAIKPLDAKSTVLTVSLAQLLAPETAPELAEAKPEVIILALSVSESLNAAPVLAERWAKAPVWGGISMGFREAAAAFAALDIKLQVSLPVANPLNAKNQAAQDFIQKYTNLHHAHPTWIAALAYDGLMLAIKAANSGSTSAEALAFLSGQSHHGLGTYTITPGGGGTPPLAFMPVTLDSLGFLP
ncbi:MAG: ABC transporter substrate-binding protein [Candidatus Adiutrix sp.]|jgi:ABC-type branched-subunit amino acid transport system substrate-binding protein|nr:ABC transporter substrate-binding protein [Candidatus Adiutrix sp.]